MSTTKKSASLPSAEPAARRWALHRVPAAVLAGLLAVAWPAGTGARETAADQGDDGPLPIDAGPWPDGTIYERPPVPEPLPGPSPADPEEGRPRSSPAPRRRPPSPLDDPFPTSRTAVLAIRLARETAQVGQRFDQARRALPTVPGPDGTPWHLRGPVAALISHTAADLDRAFERVGEPQLAALEAWAALEIGRAWKALGATPGTRAAAGSSLRPATTVFAALRPPSQWAFAGVATTEPRPDAISTARSHRLLDHVGSVLGKLFVLARHDDLEVQLWVGSTPAPAALFRFWAQGRIRGASPTPVILRTNGRRRVLRGLYAYSADRPAGTAAESLAVPPRPGSSPARIPSERLDLVTGSSYFCCRFAERYCHHVTQENECRPAKR